MRETIDLGKEKNFFEARVTEYQIGGSLAWQLPEPPSAKDL
jgi:ribonucleoside-diphosphate reductase beta chain